MAKTPLLILDDFGLKPLDTDSRRTLLQIMEYRYRWGAAIITSLLPVNKWYGYVNEPTLADAILDGLAAHAHRIDQKKSH